MSILSNAFQHALNARERVVGVREKIILSGGEPIDALVEIPAFSPEPIAGGVANPNTFLCHVAVSEFTDPPDIGDDVEVRGQTLQILEVQNVNQITYGLLVGDASYE